MSDKNNISAGDIISALSNNARISIYFYLQIYKELTLERLQKLLGKSKTSIHYNVQFMISLGVIDEKTKPGSKTRFYTLNKQRLDESMREAFDDENIKSMTKDKQIEIMQTYMQLSKALILIVQNISNLMMKHYDKLGVKDILKNVDDPNAYLSGIAGKNIQAIYNASEENWSAFVGEFAALIDKYYTMEAEHPKRIRPYSFVMIGGNIEDYLQK